MEYIALDVHKKYTWARVEKRIDESDNFGLERRTIRRDLSTNI
jgi:hypothetical protein